MNYFEKCYKIIILFLILHAVSTSNITQYFQAFNISCLNTSYFSASPGSPIYITLPIFSDTRIQIDLRHLDTNQTLKGVSLTLFIQNLDLGANYTENLGLNISTSSYSFYASNNIIISASFIITDINQQFVIGKSYLFSKSVSATIFLANNQNLPEYSFLFVLTNQDFISLPYNIITQDNANNFDGYFLTQLNTAYSMYSRQSKPYSYTNFWNGLSSIALPYVPYFSNCADEGDYLYFSQMIHNYSQCKLYGANSIPINQFKFGSSATADSCSITRSCVYDEIPSITSQYPYWNTLDSGATYLFSVTSLEQPSNSLTTTFPQTQLVPCKLKTTAGSNATGKYPLKISLSFGYYQITSELRQIVTCQVDYSLYVDSTDNFTYSLNISFSPLNHTQILLNFGFKWYIYMIVFIIIGFVSNVQFLIFWLYHLLITIKPVRKFNLKIYLRLLKQILKGVFPASLFIVFFVLAIQVVMNGTFFGLTLFSNYSTFWDLLIVNNIGVFATVNQGNTQSGRFGFVQLLIASYIMVELSNYLVGTQRKKEQYQQYQILGRKFKPQEWNRGMFLCGTFLYLFAEIVFIYFTYSPIFNLYIWEMIAMMQIFQMIIQEISYSIFDDCLTCMPLKINLGVLGYLATMGAIDLYYFILGYLIDVGISTIQIAYLSQLQQKMTKFVEEKSEEINKFYLNLLNDEQQQNEKKSKINTVYSNESILINEYINQVQLMEDEIEEQYNQIDMSKFEQNSIELDIKNRYIQYLISKNNKNSKKKQGGGHNYAKNEQNLRQQQEFENNKFQLLIDGTSCMLQYLVQPIIILILWITYTSSTILSNFQITSQNTILYLLSSVILAIFFQINIIIIFHVVQLYLNFDYMDLIKTLLDQCQNKTTFWIADQDKINNSLEIKIRSCYSYSLNFQMFFIVTLYTYSMYLFINGFCTMVQASYNMFKDPYAVIIVLFWAVVILILKWVIKKIFLFFDIWGYSSLSADRAEETNIEMVSSMEQQTHEMLRRQDIMGSTIRFTFKNINQEVQKNNFQASFEDQRKHILQSKLKTVCKKLQPQFNKEDFRLQFAKKNKDFIRKNIEKILPLVKQFPKDDASWLGKNHQIQSSEIKKENKNCDPIISDFLSSWLKRVETNRSKRNEEGIEHERMLKKCNFCFNSWNLYYGYDGMCLDCSKKLFNKQKSMKKD